MPPAVIVSRSDELTPFPEMVELARKYKVALLRSNEATCVLMGSLLSVLNMELAPRITRHGVLVEVYGEGILIVGDSGIGKSELAIELVKRGHRLVADDAVELRKVSNRQIMGTAPENIRHFIELRGVGLINVSRVYGAGAVKVSETVDLVVELAPWDPRKNYQRTGLENEYYDILGVKIPSTEIPVSPGRNLAVVIETAAVNNRQKKMGYNAAKDLLTRLGANIDNKLYIGLTLGIQDLYQRRKMYYGEDYAYADPSDRTLPLFLSRSDGKALSCHRLYRCGRSASPVRFSY